MKFSIDNKTHTGFLPITTVSDNSVGIGTYSPNSTVSNTFNLGNSQGSGELHINGKFSKQTIDMMVPLILKAIGLRPGDNLVVRSMDGFEREIPLEHLNNEAIEEIHDE